MERTWWRIVRRAERREEGRHNLDAPKQSETQMKEPHGLAQGSFFVATFFGIVLWTTVGVAAEGSSFAASDVVTRGAIELGGTVGYAQGTTVIGAGPSANRSAVLVMPRVGIVLTDPLGNSWCKAMSSCWWSRCSRDSPNRLRPKELEVRSS